MSEHTHTTIVDSRGNVHAGSGDQYIVAGHVLFQDSRGRGPRSLADDQLLWLWRRFVHPTGFGEARAMLSRTNTVLLDATPGSGRTSAARVLLHELGSGSLHELLPGDRDGGSRLDPDLVGAGDRLLLDLSSADPDHWAEVREELSSFRKSVRDQRAHLVVVLPHHRVDSLAADLDRYRVELVRPRGGEVLRRHLEKDGVPRDTFVQPAPALGGFLGVQRPMRDIAGLARLIVRARATAPDSETFAQWCARARDAMTDRGPQVARQVAGLRHGAQRAVLMSAAMLHGAHADVVHRATTALLHAAGHPENERPLLEHQDLAERLAEIAAAPDGAGRVHFDELDYERAVRKHFWDHLPDLRAPLRSWVSRTVQMTDTEVPQDDLDRLVHHLAQQYLRTGRWDQLVSLAEQWTAAPASFRHMRAAAHLLEHGLGHPHHGRRLRAKIYDWATSGRLGDDLSHVLVGVCAQVISVRHPDEAMVRLHHLARRERDTTRARDALCELVSTNHRLLRRMLARLDAGSGYASDPRIFLSIAQPRLLTDSAGRPRALLAENIARGHLVAGWNSVFRQVPWRVWRPHVRHWLHCAREDAHHGELLLNAMVDAAEQHGGVFAALYALARETEATDPAEHTRATAMAELLLQKISLAQGLHAPRTGPAHSTRETTP
ncbi:hypothetical protein ACFVRD_25335 [Streptomyces sp. NPDC057908]|uniref:hypothetical protein n=1 Tax=Streptomyces sp. NPDC057908 TaxID=3346276 RepID=UPI0036E34B87